MLQNVSTSPVVSDSCSATPYPMRAPDVLRSSAVGTFAQTRIILPRALHGAANLHPVYLVLDVRSYRVVAMDVSTSTSSYYMGTGTGSTSAPYNNNPKLSVKLPYAASTMKSDNDYLYLSSSASIVRVSLTTGMVTTTLVFMEGGQAVSKNNNMGLYKGHFFVAPRASTCVVMGPVTNPTLEMSECAWEVDYTADLNFAVPSSGSHLFAVGQRRIARYDFSVNVLEKGPEYIFSYTPGVDIHGEYIYFADTSSNRVSINLQSYTMELTPTRTPSATLPTRTSMLTRSKTRTPTLPFTETPTPTATLPTRTSLLTRSNTLTPTTTKAPTPTPSPTATWSASHSYTPST
eukprot:PhM_4_TR18760/c4_g4_i3/m.4273